MSFRDFVVNIKDNLLDPLPLHQGILGPFLSTIYITPLSSLISDSPVKHHLYAKCKSLSLFLPSTSPLTSLISKLPVSKTPHFSHISPILKSLHWLEIDQRIQYKVLQSHKPSYLYNLLNLQANTSTRSSTVITLQGPPVNSHLKITDRPFTQNAPALCKRLPKELRNPLSRTSSINLSPSRSLRISVSLQI